MTTEKTTLLACPVCHTTDFLRANVKQDVNVTVSQKGDIKSGHDFSAPEVDDSGELFCAQCGEHIQLTYKEPDYELMLDE